MTDIQHRPIDLAHQFREYVAILRARFFSIVLVTAVVFAAALALSFNRTPIYESRARVLVKPVALISGRAETAVSPNMKTESELARSAPVAQQAALKLGTTEPIDDLRKPLTISTEAETEILEFHYDHEHPRIAEDRAAAFANAYLEYRRNQAITDLQGAAAPIRRQMQSLNTQLADVNARLAVTGDPGQRGLLQARATSLIGEIAIAQQRLASFVGENELQVGQLIEPANFPKRPAKPNHILDGLLALFAGLALGTGVALLRERLDDRLREREDLSHVAHAPILGLIPRFPERKHGEQAGLVLHDIPHSAVAESFRALRSSVVFAANQRGAKTILITSALSGEGKTVLTANLAVALAQAGRSVVAVSADLRRPVLHKLFRTPQSPGLTNVLSGDATLAQTLLFTSEQNVRVLAAGNTHAGSADMLNSEDMRRLLKNLGAMADVVLVDSGPILAVADALVLSPMVDAVLLVAAGDGTTRSAVRRARQQLELVNAPLIGAVLNKFDPAKWPGQEYYYEYEHSADESLRNAAPKTISLERPAPPAVASSAQRSAEGEEDPPFRG